MKSNRSERRAKRVAVFITAVLIAVAFMPFAGEAAYAETIPGYDAETAVSFAMNNTKNYKDCVKFVRACAEKGGVPRQSAVKSYSPVEYMTYLVNFGYAVKNQLTLFVDDGTKENRIYVRLADGKKVANLPYEDNVGKIAPGDLLIYKCKKCGKHFHMAIVTETRDTLDYYNDDGPFRAWMLEAQSDNGKIIKGQPFYLYNHNSSHGRNNVVVYALHFTSADNGFEANDAKVGTLTAKKISKKQARLKWKAVEGAVAYNIYTRGYTSGPVKFVKQVKATNVKVAIPKNNSGKLYNYKNVRYTVAPVFEHTATFESVTKTYKVPGKRRALVKVK